MFVSCAIVHISLISALVPVCGASFAENKPLVPPPRNWGVMHRRSQCKRSGWVPTKRSRTTTNYRVVVRAGRPSRIRVGRAGHGYLWVESENCPARHRCHRRQLSQSRPPCLLDTQLVMQSRRALVRFESHDRDSRSLKPLMSQPALTDPLHLSHLAPDPDQPLSSIIRACTGYRYEN